MTEKIDYEKLATLINDSYVKLVKYLYDNHRSILRDYEKKVLKSKLRIEFI